MSTDNRDALVDTIIASAVKGENDVLAKTAALQAATALAKLVLNDLKRIADAHEVMAKAVLERDTLVR